MTARELAIEIFNIFTNAPTPDAIDNAVFAIEQYTRELTTIYSMPHPSGTVFLVDDEHRMIRQGKIAEFTSHPPEFVSLADASITKETQ